jgi:MFS family permease
MSAGSFAGALAAGFVSDHFGRRGALIIASVIWIIGAVLQLSAQNVAHLVAGRVVSGLCGMFEASAVRAEIHD